MATDPEALSTLALQPISGPEASSAHVAVVAVAAEIKYEMPTPGTMPRPVVKPHPAVAEQPQSRTPVEKKAAKPKREKGPESPVAERPIVQPAEMPAELAATQPEAKKVARSAPKPAASRRGKAAGISRRRDAIKDILEDGHRAGGAYMDATGRVRYGGYAIDVIRGADGKVQLDDEGRVHTRRLGHRFMTTQELEVLEEHAQEIRDGLENRYKQGSEAVSRASVSVAPTAAERQEGISDADLAATVSRVGVALGQPLGQQVGQDTQGLVKDLDSLASSLDRIVLDPTTGKLAVFNSGTLSLTEIPDQGDVDAMARVIATLKEATTNTPNDGVSASNAVATPPPVVPGQVDVRGAGDSTGGTSSANPVAGEPAIPPSLGGPAPNPALATGIQPNPDQHAQPARAERGGLGKRTLRRLGALGLAVLTVTGIGFTAHQAFGDQAKAGTTASVTETDDADTQTDLTEELGGGAEQQEQTVVLAKGQNPWTVSRAHLKQLGVDHPTQAQIWKYDLKLAEINGIDIAAGQDYHLPVGYGLKLPSDVWAKKALDL